MRSYYPLPGVPGLRVQPPGPTREGSAKQTHSPHKPRRLNKWEHTSLPHLESPDSPTSTAAPDSERYKGTGLSEIISPDTSLSPRGTVASLSPPPSFSRRFELGGVTSSAKIRNVRANQAIDLLSNDVKAKAPSSPASPTPTTPSASPSGGMVLSASVPNLHVHGEEDFATTLGKIAVLRNSLENFTPRTSSVATSSRQKKGKGARRTSALLSTEEEERLEAYKMVRRLEPELPPIRPLDSSELPSLPPQSWEIMQRNCSSETLRSFLPNARKELLRSRQQQRQERSITAELTRKELHDARCAHLAQDLGRKSRQGEKATAEKKGKVPTHMTYKEQETTVISERWLVILHITHFIRLLKEEVVVRRIPTGDRLSYLAKNAERIKHLRPLTPFLQRLLGLAQGHDNAKFVHTLTFATVRLQSNMVKHARRRQARSIVNVLESWRTAGPLIVLLRKFALKVVRLQRWWRTIAEHLVLVRDRVSKRWERLERNLIFREMNDPKGEYQLQNAALGPDKDPKVHKEEFIKKVMICDEHRLTFLEHELRARRYNVLAALEIWRAEVADWSAGWENWRETRNGAEKDGMPLKLPPVQPSYLPPAHLFSEEKGNVWCGSCKPWCHGRRGDEDVLDMIRRARRRRNSKKGWLEISPKKEFEPPTQKTHFWDVPEEELARWGVDNIELAARPMSSSSPFAQP